MKILFVFGTRPETIKMAPLIERLKREKGVQSFICVTGQHREMLDPFLRLFQIKADYDLKIMKPGQSLSGIGSAVLIGLHQILVELKPDLLIVQGDTTTALAGALAAFYEKIPIGHLEAGLRTGDPMIPWPEEGNRKMISSIASFHFAPTEKSAENLRKEGIRSDTIFVTGNTVIDALFFTLNQLEKNPALKTDRFHFLNPEKKLIVVTGHRRENFGQGFQSICHAIRTLSERDDVEIVYPVHLNPNVQAPVYSILGNRKNVHLIEPLDYIDFVFLMNLSYLILTDSGGIQEEAPSLGKPVLVLREVTERPEAVEAGTVLLVGTEKANIVKETEKLLDDPLLYRSMSERHNPYGDGQAAERIVKHLVNS